MNMVFHVLSVWQTVSPMLKIRVVTVYKQLWGLEAALPSCHGLESLKITAK